MWPRSLRCILWLLCLLLPSCESRGRLSTRPPAPSASVPPRSTNGVPVTSGAPAVPPPALSPGALIEDERNTIEVFRQAAASTVFVTQKRVVMDYFGGRALELPSGSGTGFVWDKQGHVVTNFHVIQNAKSLSVALHDQQTFDAKVVGAEPRKDIAVLKIDAPPEALTPIRRRDKALPLEVGQKVIAIGNPFGLDHTVTTGIVSALGREVDGIGGVTIRDMIQTDAAINPGNSGGPLLDSSGHLIGMNTMIFSRSGAWAGIGFAVPVATVLRVVPQIIKTGRAEQVGIGVQIDPQQRIERRLRIRGVAVLSVVPDTPAAKAGLKGIEQTPRGLRLGDVIVAVDDVRIENYDDLYNTLDQHRPGDVVELTVVRGRDTVKLKLPLIGM